MTAADEAERQALDRYRALRRRRQALRSIYAYHRERQQREFARRLYGPVPAGGRWRILLVDWVEGLLWLAVAVACLLLALVVGLAQGWGR